MGDGSARLPIMIVGEAPGSQEDATARVFVGRAGKLLRTTLTSVGLNPASLYITNAVKCFPDGTPTGEEIGTCSSYYLQREIRELKPRLTLVLGGSAAKAFDLEGTITSLRGKLHHSEAAGPVFAVFHPAYVLRNRRAESLFRNDLAVFAAVVRLELGLDYEDHTKVLSESE